MKIAMMALRPFVWAAGALVLVAALIWWIVARSERDPVESATKSGAEAGSVVVLSSVASVPSPAAVQAESATVIAPREAVSVFSPVPPVAQQGDERPRELVEIEAAVVTYSATALPALAKYLVHPEPSVREAARDGFLQMGLAEGAAYLREAADKVRDPREAVQLLDAADFLELPVLPVKAGPGVRPASSATRERLERERAAGGAR